MNRLIIAAGIVLAGCATAWADSAAVVAKPVFTGRTTASGQPLVLPKTNAEVVVSTLQIPAGARLPVHKHVFPRYAYVLSGVLQVSNTDTGSSKEYRAGDFIVEAVDQWHFGMTVGNAPVSLLVIDQIEVGKGNTILKEP